MTEAPTWPQDGPEAGPPGASAALAFWQPDDDPAAELVDHDFDASWAERGVRPKRVRILGKVYELPVEPPAMFVLFQARQRGTDRNAKIAPQEIVELLGATIGKANVDALLSQGIGLNRLTDVMRYCMDAMKQGRQETRQGEAPAPTGAAANGMSG